MLYQREFHATPAVIVCAQLRHRNIISKRHAETIPLEADHRDKRIAGPVIQAAKQLRGAVTRQVIIQIAPGHQF
jgi:hypothetical protein